jgi:hypothetical protein
MYHSHVGFAFFVGTYNLAPYTFGPGPIAGNNYKSMLCDVRCTFSPDVYRGPLHIIFAHGLSIKEITYGPKHDAGGYGTS